jgi:hypothetical protein
MGNPICVNIFDIKYINYLMRAVNLAFGVKISNLIMVSRKSLNSSKTKINRIKNINF